MNTPDSKAISERMTRYRATLRRRVDAERRRCEKRTAQAGRFAGRAAWHLKQQYGARRVVLFGSVAAGRRLSERSDVDLMVWGCSPVQHLDALAAHIEEEFKAEVVIPSRKNAKEPREIDRELYEDQNKIERFIGRVKHYRRVATRYEKTARNYLAFLQVASIMTLLL